MRRLARAVRFVGGSTLRFVAWRLGPATPARRRAHFSAWARWLLAVLGVRVARRGTAPEPPCLLVANHVSYLDVVVLAAETGAVFVAKGEVSRWPWIGLLARGIGTIFVDRGRRSDLVRVNGEISAALDRGEGVVVFPEGTSTDGSHVVAFKTGLLEEAARRGIPVRPARIRYDAPSVAWWGEMEFLPHLWDLFAISSIECDLDLTLAPVVATDRKALAEALHDRIASPWRAAS